MICRENREMTLRAVRQLRESLFQADPDYKDPQYDWHWLDDPEMDDAFGALADEVRYAARYRAKSRKAAA